MGHQCLKCGILYPEGSTVILRGCPDCRGTRFFYTTDALGADERKRMMSGTELTLREAIEELVQQAKDGTVDPEADQWMLAGPAARPILVDPKLVPPDLPSKPKELETVAKIREALAMPSKVVVKVPKDRRKRAKREGPRWDYVAPSEPAIPVTQKPPLAAPEVNPPAPTVAPQPSPPTQVPPTPAGPMPSATTQSTLPLEREQAPAEALAAVAAAIHDEASPMSADERPETIHISRPGEYEIDVKRLLESSPVVIQKDGTYLIHLASLFESVPRSKK